MSSFHRRPVDHSIAEIPDRKTLAVHGYEGFYTASARGSQFPSILERLMNVIKSHKLFTMRCYFVLS
jgi:hypothetical protein